MNINLLNKQFKIVFQPNKPELYGNRRRFGIGTRQLSNYITQSNADVVQKMVEKHILYSPTHTVHVKFRKYGKISVYML